MVTRVETVAIALGRHVADGGVFYQRLRMFHWNVRGEEFFRLHEQFEKLYRDWEGVVDLLAERALTIGGSPPGTLKEFLAQTSLAEFDSIPSPREMVRRVIDDLDLIVEGLKQTQSLAEQEKDPGTSNLLQGLIEKEEKHAWMLRSWISEKERGPRTPRGAVPQ